MNNKTLLVVGAHHDDCEYAAGGLIIKAVKKGWRVVLATLTGDHSSWRHTMKHDPKVVRDNLLEVAREMGVEKRFYNWGYHELYYNRESVNIITELALEIKPQLALVHWAHDYWPDHAAAGKIAKHALWFPTRDFVKRGAESGGEGISQMLAFEAGPNQNDAAIQFRPDVYIDVSEEIDAALRILGRIHEAISGEAASATSSHDPEKSAKGAKARLRGIECGRRYAEAFISFKKIPQDILS